MAAWAHQNQVWLRGDYTAGYEYGRGFERGAEVHGLCQERAEEHCDSPDTQVVFRGGCGDGVRGKALRPEAAGGFVSDARDLWGPFG